MSGETISCQATKRDEWRGRWNEPTSSDAVGAQTKGNKRKRKENPRHSLKRVGDIDHLLQETPDQENRVGFTKNR